MTISQAQDVEPKNQPLQCQKVNLKAAQTQRADSSWYGKTKAVCLHSCCCWFSLMLQNFTNCPLTIFNPTPFVFRNFQSYPLCFRNFVATRWFLQFPFESTLWLIYNILGTVTHFRVTAPFSFTLQETNLLSTFNTKTFKSHRPWMEQEDYKNMKTTVKMQQSDSPTYYFVNFWNIVMEKFGSSGTTTLSGQARTKGYVIRGNLLHATNCSVYHSYK